MSPGQAREQRACGARVIMVTGEQAALREQIAAARAQAPLTEAETLPELREIFAAHATPVRLAALASLAGLPDHLVTGRQIAVLARVEDAAGAAALAARLRRAAQRARRARGGGRRPGRGVRRAVLPRGHRRAR